MSTNAVIGSLLARTAVSAFGLSANLRDEHEPRATMAARATREYVFTNPPYDRRARLRDPAQHQAGRLGIFTPMYLLHGRKPA